MRWLAAFAVFAGAGMPGGGQADAMRTLVSVSSPDGRTTIALVRRGDKGPVFYRVTRDRGVILDDSPLGLKRADQPFDPGAMTFAGAAPERAVDERYTMPHGKAHAHHAVARERVATFRNEHNARLEIILRAQNDGVAFRYRFPEHISSDKTVTEELTGFHVPDGSTAGWMRQQEVHKYAPAYEDFYMEVKSGTASERADGWAFP